MRKIFLQALLVLSLLPATALAQEAKPTWQSNFSATQLIGSGQLRWFGLHVYQAKLWAETANFAPQGKFALELTYERSISKKRFVSVSLDEMRRLLGSSLPADQLPRWEALMQSAFIDVKEGDQLIGVHLPGLGVRFYSRDKMLAEIRDPAFAQAFFAIWFDPRSKDAKLRQQLTGAMSGAASAASSAASSAVTSTAKPAP